MQLRLGLDLLNPAREYMSNNAEALLIYPPVYDFALYDLFLKPFGLLRLGAMLEAGGWNTRFINALDYKDSETAAVAGLPKRGTKGTGKFFRTPVDLPETLSGIKRRFARYGILPEVFKRKVAERRPDAVFISSGMTYWYPGVVEAVDTVREIWPGVPVIIGGIYASLMQSHCASVCDCDFIVVGEAGTELNNFLQKNGLPSADTEQSFLPLDSECWSDAAVLRLNEGCPFNCDYCASKAISPNFRAGRAEDVLDWVIKVNMLHGTSNFAFYDDALLVNSHSILKPFLKEIIRYREVSGRSLSFYTPNAMHIRFIDPEAAYLMKQAGFREVRLGFESESDDFHAEHDRKHSESGFHESIRILSDAGFKSSEIIVYILAGLPGQYAEEVEQTIRFAAGKGLSLSVAEFSTVPGSSLWNRCVKESCYPIEYEPLFHNNSFFPMEWSGFTRDDMQRLKNLSKVTKF